MGEAAVGAAVSGTAISEPGERDPHAGDTAVSERAAPRVRPGAFDRFYAWADRLPWRGLWLYPAMAAGLLLWGHSVLWATGRLAVGTFDPTLTVSVVYVPYGLWVIGYLNRVAGRALDAFWPATGWPDRDRASWSHALTTVGAGLAVPSLLVGIGIAVVAFLSAPVTVVGADVPGRLAYALALAPNAILGYAIALMAIAHTSRQLRLVVRIHREAHAIDPFDKGPVYAFSRFTVQIGLAFLVSGYYTFTVNAAFQSGNLVGGGFLGLVFVLGAACFILPLWGIHGRLVDVKEAQTADVELRISKLARELYRRIDAGEFDGTKVINEAIAAAGAVRERIERLPTWPWPPQLFRGFLSALLVPVVVYLATRLIGGQIGA
jgi:hypothetical protein